MWYLQHYQLQQKKTKQIHLRVYTVDAHFIAFCSSNIKNFSCSLAFPVLMYTHLATALCGDQHGIHISNGKNLFLKITHPFSH